MRLPTRFGPVALALALLGPPAHAQPPAGVPTKPAELFDTFRQLLGQGKYDLAAAYLKAFSDANPSDPELLAFDGAAGAGTFQNLQTVPKWSDDPAAEKAARETVNALVARVRAAGDKVFRDPARIATFVSNLGKSYHERVYAQNELVRAGDAAVPFLVEAYRTGPSPAQAGGILDTLPRQDAASVAGWLAALDGFTPEQRFGVLSALLNRTDLQNLPAFAETDYTPFLWYLAALPADQAPALRRLARDLLGRQYPGAIETRGPVAELVRIARTFYERTARFRTATNADRAAGTVVLWSWNPKAEKLERAENASVARAEEYYGLRYARWALDRKPDDAAAQRLIVALAADNAVERGKFGDLGRTAPSVHRLLADTPTALIGDLLGEAMARKRTPLAFAMAQALADRADASLAAGDGEGVRPARRPVLVRALDYPDVRVQLVAANGLLRSRAALSPAARSRVLEILRGAVGADGGVAPTAAGQALLVDPNRMRNDSTAALLRDLGYSVEQYAAGRDLLRRTGTGSDFDLVLVDRHVVAPQLHDFLSQLRADAKSAGVPVAVVASTDAVRRPTLDGLMLRLAVLIAATETDGVEVPAPFVPDIRQAAERNDEVRASTRLRRDGALRTLSRTRMARLTRVADNSDITFTAPQRAFLALRIEQLTWAVLSLQYPISVESSPTTAEHLETFHRLFAAQPPLPPYAELGVDGLARRIELLQTDVDAQAAVKARYDALRSAVDVEALGIDVGSTRDTAVEAAATRVAQSFPGVVVIPEPFSRVGFEGDLRKAYADGGRVPRGAAEKKAAAAMALEWLRQMATGERVGFDVRPAEAELRAALASDDLAPAAIEAVGTFRTGESQQALLRLAATPLRPAHIRLRAADAAIRHVQANGKLTARNLIDELLVPQAVTEQNAEVRAKLVVLKGILAFSERNYLADLQQFTPAPDAPAEAVPAAPVVEPKPKE